MAINQSALTQLEHDVGAEMMPVILKQFLQELETQADKLVGVVREQDLAALVSLAHSLKSTARTIGLDSVADCAEKLEQLGREGRSADVWQLSTQLQELCAGGHDELQGLVS